MRIYYQMGETIFGDDDLAKALGQTAGSVHIIALELLKYKMMWALRFLEDEINNSEGIITIHSDRLGSKTNITITGFSDELIEKIKAIAKSSKF